jgi:hypothetical protein
MLHNNQMIYHTDQKNNTHIICDFDGCDQVRCRP